MTLIHEQALLVLTLPIRNSAGRERITRRAAVFFAEAILPLEKTHRSALDASLNMSRLNQALKRQILALAASHRTLKMEITKREAVERTLRRSEQRSLRHLNQSRRLQEQLRLLSRRILKAQEDERKRISRELHDVVAQALTSINLRLAILKNDATVNARGLTRSIARTQELVEKSVEIVHRFACELRPAVLDYLGLIPALHSYMKNFTKETGIRASMKAFAGVEELSNAKRTAFYRVAQEALTNVARHAQASRVEASIRRIPKAVCLEIKDNGKSFDAERILHADGVRCMGLLGMRERIEMVGGTFAIESAPGKGTTIRAQIPFRGVA